MKTEEVILRLIAVYRGKDGYGYGTTQTKTVEKEFTSLTELRKWVEENGSVEEFSGHGVTTRLSLCSYKTYRIECVESYKDGCSYKSYAYNREFNVGDEVLHVVSDVRITSPLKGIVKSVSCGRYIEVYFDGYGSQTFDFDDMSVYK
jgi:hypothetical protein